MFFLNSNDEFEEEDVEIHFQSSYVVGQCSKTSHPKFQHRPPLTRKTEDLFSWLGNLICM